MINAELINIIKEQNRKSLISMIDKQGKVNILASYAEVLDKRAYFTVDKEGEIKRKKFNLPFLTFAYLDNHEILAENLIKYIDFRERQNFDKIERYSNIELEKVKQNFIKTLVNGNLYFAKRYGKELFLRDRKGFYEMATKFACMGESTSQKSLFVLSLKRLLPKDYNEGIFYLFISYLCKYRDDFNRYERAKLSKNVKTIEEIRGKVLIDSEIQNSMLGLGILTTLKLIEEEKVSNKAQILAKLSLEISEMEERVPLTSDEELLLKEFL